MQNECTLHKTAICTYFWAVYSKMLCNMLQNALHFGAKRKAKRCKTQGETHKNTHQSDRKTLSNH
jgi:hypothetical protein